MATFLVFMFSHFLFQSRFDWLFCEKKSEITKCRVFFQHLQHRKKENAVERKRDYKFSASSRFCTVVMSWFTPALWSSKWMSRLGLKAKRQWCSHKSNLTKYKTIPKNTVYCFSATLVIHNILDDLQQSCSNLHRPKAPSATFSGLYFSTMESYMTVINIFQHFDLPKNSFKATNKENLWI